MIAFRLWHNTCHVRYSCNCILRKKSAFAIGLRWRFATTLNDKIPFMTVKFAPIAEPLLPFESSGSPPVDRDLPRLEGQKVSVGAAPGKSYQPSSAAAGLAMLERLLEEQQTTAVESFSDLHQNHAPAADAAPAQARYYRSLLPATPPQAGEQYAFEVDLDSCSGCKACVTACHTLNGLDEHETWRGVGLLHGGSSLGGQQPYLQHVTTACHHCVEPGCLLGCPTNAYEKDPVTGIVRHLDDQCFGCQYCILACPYEVPQFLPRLGIVRKCDMCSQRLAVGEAPACVQACPHQAIRIRAVNQAEITAACETQSLVPTAPHSNLTKPTTVYRTQRTFPENINSANAVQDRPQHAHPPLSLMLVLMQASWGTLLFVGLLSWFVPVFGQFFNLQETTKTFLNSADSATFSTVANSGILLAWLFAAIGLTCSTLHLGRPLLAFRIVLGFRHSWLSREALAFGAYFAALSLLAGEAAIHFLPNGDERLSYGDSLLANFGLARVVVQQATLVSAIFLGAVGVYCSAMIYIWTKRAYWTARSVGIKFGLSSVILGSQSLALAYSFVMQGASNSTLESTSMISLFLGIAVATLLFKLAYESRLFRHLYDTETSVWQRSALLQARELAGFRLGRIACGMFGGLILPLIAFAVRNTSIPAPALQVTFNSMLLMMFALTFAGELLERWLFFTASIAPRMPGAHA